MPHSGICKGVQCGSLMVAGFAPLFFLQFFSYPPLLFREKKRGFCGTAGQQGPDKKPTTDRWDSLHNKQPSPTADSQPMHMIENDTGERCAQDGGDGQASQKPRNHLCLLTLPEPVSKIQDDPGEKPGLSHPQQKPDYIQLRRAVHQAAQHGYRSPTHQDAGNPQARAHVVQNEVARYFKQEVTAEENSGQKPELGAGDTQFLVHGERREADVDPVQVSNDVEKKKKRQDTALELADGGSSDGRRACDGCAHCCVSFTKGALACCLTISIAAWLLVTTGIPSFFCKRSMFSMARQLVQESNRQSGSIPFICASTNCKISSGVTRPISRFALILIPAALIAGNPASAREREMLLVRSSIYGVSTTIFCGWIELKRINTARNTVTALAPVRSSIILEVASSGDHFPNAPTQAHV